MAVVHCSSSLVDLEEPQAILK